MIKGFKTILKVVLSLAIVFSAMPFAQTIPAQAAQQEYEIYPKPHSMSYQDGNYVMRPVVNVVYDAKIDEPTKKRLSEILTSKDKEVRISDKKIEGVTNIFVGTWGSNGPAESYIKANYSLDSSLFEKFGGHYAASNNGEIVILGKDTTAAFYGITSLKHIFSQIDGSTLRNFTIGDYADTNIRGFIEGYYGIPWSNEDRMSLMEFGGDFKMTAYVFAPKNDEYHTSKWRELYPEEKLAGIKEMVQVGIDSKCSFVWTAHPFMGGFNSNKIDEEIGLLLNKFDQLYEAGVRQFGVLGDDVGSLNRSVVIQVMQAVSDWGKAKGDVLDPVFCPAGYNDSWQGDYSELNDYDKGFPEDVQIFWTGQAVCQPVEQKTLDNFKKKNLAEGQSARRNPLFWLNWPVNDINGSRLLMGKGALLHTDININDLNGVVSNPMQEAEASKPALFAVADYAWNVKEFNDDQSWADSFKYIDENAGDDLHTLAKHMSNPQPNGHGLVQPESEELAPLIDAFEADLTNGDSINEKGTELIQQMEIIMKAADNFQAKSQNEKMKKELSPFTDSLKDLCNSIKLYTEAGFAIENGNDSLAFDRYTQATSYFTNSKNHERALLNGVAKVSPGSTRLIPLANALQKAYSDKISEIVSGGETKLKLTPTSSFTSFYGGTKIENIVDNSLDTAAWHDGYEKAGQYFQVDLSVPTTIYGVDIYNGTKDKPSDTFGYAKVKYSTDHGATWKDMSSTEYGEYATNVKISGISIDNVTNVRYESTRVGSGNKWPAMREFKVLTDPSAEGPVFTSSVIRTSEAQGWSIYGGNENSLFDNDDNTGVHYRVRQNEPENSNTSIVGDYVGVKLSEPITLGKIHFAQAPSAGSNDYFHNEDLQYSMDGVNWTTIKSYTNTRDIDIDVSDQEIRAQYVRVVNTKNVNVWVGMREMRVESKVYFNGKAYTNVDDYKTVETNCLNDQALMKPTDGIKLAKGEYIGIKLKRLHQLKDIKMDVSEGDDLTLKISQNGVEWETVSAGTTNKIARYIILENDTDKVITFDVNAFSVDTNEIQPITIKSSSGFTVQEAANVFDGSLTTQTNYQGNQNQGSNFVYDLGQTIDLTSFKAICRDSEIDFPRHGKFSVSKDGTNWMEIMTLGNQDSDNPGESTNTDDINFVLPSHEISYNAKKVEDLNVKARYLKFEITRTKAGSSKWVRFQELELNDGAYLPTENDPTITSSSMETRGGLKKYMTDNDLTTMFIPKDKSGSFTYVASDKGNVLNTIKIIQNSNKISNAVVHATYITNAARADKQTVTLGTLSQTINEFQIPNDAILLDIKVEWDNADLNITEFSVYNKASSDVDKSVLNDLLTSKEDTAAWTRDSKTAYDTAIAAGTSINESTGVTQTSVDAVIKSIQNAIAEKVLRGDTTVLQSAIDNAFKDATKYTSSTWKAYNNAINSSVKALEDEENLSQNDIDAYVNAVNEAQGGLKFNPNKREESILTIMDIDAFKETITNPEEVYTVSSYADLEASYDALVALIATDDTTSQDPDVFKAANEKLLAAKENLIDIQALKAVITSAKDLNAADYTPESYAVLTGAITAGEALYVEGSKEAVDQAVEAVKEAIKQLAPATGKESIERTVLDAAVKKAMIISDAGLDHIAKPVVDRFNMALQAAVDVLANPESTPEAMMDAWLNLANAMHYLDFRADKTQLNALIVEADIISANLDSYKEEGKQEFIDALAHAKEVAASDTALDDTSINPAHDRLATAISRLKPVDNFDTTVLQYIIKQADEAMADEQYYQKNDAWDTYVAAYNKAKDVYASPSSQKEINDAVIALASAYEDIRLIPDEEHLQEYAILKYLLDETKVAIDEADYYEKNAAWDAFVKAYDKAELIYGHANSRKALRLAATTLTDAYENIRLIANEDLLRELNSFIKSIDALDSSLYSAEDYAILKDAKEYAQTLYARGKFTAEERSSFDEKKAAADEAVKRVVETPETPQDPPMVPGEPVQPEESTDPTAPSEKAPSAPAQNNNVVRPAGTAKTGDTTNVMGLGAMMLVSAGAYLVLKKRKNSSK